MTNREIEKAFRRELESAGADEIRELCHYLEDDPGFRREAGLEFFRAAMHACVRLNGWVPA
jgi:hypothetical protein